MMQQLLVLFAGLAAVTSSMAIEARPPHSRARNALLTSLLSRQHPHTVSHLASNPMVRPSKEAGVPDMVRFSLLCRTFFGTNFQDGTFSADLVLTVAWNDTRAVDLVPEGEESITLPLDAFQGKHWDPSVVVTSRAIRGTEVVTSAIEVNVNGSILLVQRILAISHNKWDVRHFPFDSQNLTLLVASSNLMLHDLQLVAPPPSFVAAKDDAFSSSEYQYIGHDVYIYQTRDGALQKSRGILVIQVKRKPGSFIQTYLVPEVLLLFISWSVFFYPPLIPFAMPRVATGIFSLLSLMTINSSTMAKLPPVRNGLTWVEVFNKNCLFLMVYTILLNVAVECVNHHWDQKELGEYLLFELRLSYPVICAFVLGACAFWPNGWRIDVLAGLTMYVLLFAFAAFLTQALLRLRGPGAKKPEAAGAGAAGAKLAEGAAHW